MKKLAIISVIINIITIILLITMYNTTISWEHNGEIYNHRLGDFFVETLKGE